MSTKVHPRAGAAVFHAASAYSSHGLRRSRGTLTPTPPVKLSGRELELIERLVCRDRPAVSSALLAVAGIGSGEVVRAAVLARVGEAAAKAKAQGAISASRAAQIARHVKRAQLDQRDAGGPAVKVV